MLTKTIKKDNLACHMFIAFIYIVGWLKYYESLGELEMAQDRKKVLVLGAGYAGLQTVTKLQRNFLLMQRNYFN